MSVSTTSTSIPKYDDFTITGTDGSVYISKELYNNDKTIKLDNGLDKKTEVRGDWKVTLLKAYKEFVMLRKAMDYYFLIDGEMKSDVKDFVEVKREDGIDFAELFNLAEALGDVSMAYFFSYFVNITIQFGEYGKHDFPLAFLRHHNGTYYSALISAMLEDADDNDVLPLIKTNKFDAEFYLEFCAFRVRVNGKMFKTPKTVTDVVKKFLDKYDLGVIYQSILFGDYIGDNGDKADDIVNADFNSIAHVCGCYMGMPLRENDNFDQVKILLDSYTKKPTQLYRKDMDNVMVSSSLGDSKDGN